jgi:large subunit ribosomal protein L20
MARVKRGTKARARRKKIMKLARGMYSGRHRQYAAAQRAVARSLKYAFAGRKQRKRDFRSLWITRINAACRANGMPYNRFIHSLKLANITLDRKSLATMAIDDPSGFQSLVEKMKGAALQ